MVEAEACKATLEPKPAVMISAGTVAAALIVAARRNVGERRDCDYDCPP
jgi:ribonuclease VapC